MLFSSQIYSEYAREFIAFSALDDTIEHKNVPIRLTLEHKHILEQRFLDVQNFVDLEGHGLPGPLGRDLAEPAI